MKKKHMDEDGNGLNSGKGEGKKASLVPEDKNNPACQQLKLDSRISNND